MSYQQRQEVIEKIENMRSGALSSSKITILLNDEF
jgi:hypothetical protein